MTVFFRRYNTKVLLYFHFARHTQYRSQDKLNNTDTHRFHVASLTTNIRSPLAICHKD